MNAIYFDSSDDDDRRRQLLYEGQLFVFSPRASCTAFRDFARELLQQAFAPLDPRKAQHSIPVEEYVRILAELKPRFIHHPDSKKCIQAILTEFDCDLEKTYFDVPRLRSATSRGYLTSGIAYAFHPHRDTWYSAPFCQINWWIPVFEIEPENAMAFHPYYWTHPVLNDSDTYNYYEWNRESRKTAAQHVKTDTRKQPHAQEQMQLDPDLRLICEPGGAIIFSGAQMHSTVPNTSNYTRFSIDFRTVHLGDVTAKRGAPNIDSACTGTTLRDYLRVTDLSRIPEEICLLYDDQPPPKDDLIFLPSKSNEPYH
jgi:hypothetical protein